VCFLQKAPFLYGTPQAHPLVFDRFFPLICRNKKTMLYGYTAIFINKNCGNGSLSRVLFPDKGFS